MHHYFVILILAIFWAPTAVLVKYLLESVSPLSIVAFSSLIAAITLSAYQYCTQRKFYRYTREQLIYCTLVGLFAHSIPFSLQCYALIYLQSIWVAIIIAAIPLFTILLSKFFLTHEKLSKQLTYGILLGFLGMMILISPSFSDFSVLDKNEFFGVMLALMAALMHAIGLILTRKKLRHPAPLAMPTLHMISATIYLLPIAMYLHPEDITFFTRVGDLLSVLWLALPGTGLAYICYYKLLNEHPAVYISLVNYILPVFKTMLGLFFLHETLTLNYLIAFILILSGIILVGEQTRHPRKILAQS